MKTKSLLMLIALVTSLVLSAQTKFTFKKGHAKQALKGFNKTASQNLPQVTANFNWDDMDESWAPSDSQFTQYDAKGNTMQVEGRYNGNFGYLNKYAYDANGRQIGEYSFNWNSMTSKWDSSSKALTTYDSQGTELEYIYYNVDWQTKNWVRGYGYKNQNVYDGTGKLTEQTVQDWVAHLNAYRNSNKGTFVYDTQGKPTLYTQMDWDTISNTFKNTFQVTDIVWHKWILNDIENSLTSSLTFKFWAVILWVNGNKQTTTYDAYDNITEDKSETWSGVSWELESQEKTMYTYNNNGAMTESIRQVYDLDSADFYNNSKSVFSNFIQFNSVSEKTNVQNELKVYPNPMVSEATISFNQPTPNTQFKLYDMVGHEVYSTKLEGQTTTIEKGNLQKGMYIYQILNQNNSVAKGKLIIQ